MILRLLPLALAVLFGVIAGSVRLFRDPDAAIDALNRFALYIAFPALIVTGVSSPELALPSGPAFVLVHLLAAGVLLTLGRFFVPHKNRGPTSMASLFGNTAYLGIPYVGSVLGEAGSGLASLSASIHVSLFMLIGPVVLLAWSPGDDRIPPGEIFRRVVRQPLLWAPLVGLGIRILDPGAAESVRSVIEPFGKAAGPVALFLLGLYLRIHVGDLKNAAGGVSALLGMKLVAYPLITVGLVLAMHQLMGLSELEGRVLLIQSAMPVAITTFALAQEFDRGQRTVASGIVLSTLIALAILPPWTWFVLDAAPL